MGRYSEMPAMELRREYRLGIQKLPFALFNLEVPVIAAVNGQGALRDPLRRGHG